MLNRPCPTGLASTLNFGVEVYNPLHTGNCYENLHTIIISIQEILIASRIPENPEGFI